MSRLAATRFPLAGCADQGLEIIAGTVTLNGGSSPTAASHVGKGFTVTRKGAGQLLVTLDSAYARILYIGPPSLRQATAGNDAAFIIDASNAPDAGDFDSRATFEIETQSIDGTAADLTGLELGIFCIATRIP